MVEWVGLRRTNVGKKLLKWCAPASFGEGTETRTDVRVRDGRQLYARDGALAVEGFDEALGEILCQVRASLCPHDAAPPIAELHSLNIYGPGGHFVAHKDTPRETSVFGTLVVCLPLVFGGSIVSFTVPANLRSRAVMQRLGMTRDPRDDFDHPKLPEGHRLRRHVLYRLSAELWSA